ncbi:MAG: hypothetical protein HXY34_01655 [Candidatus Thorarchaeota archaeon]|nr:hypothetical protein [Candidatus Thorarchaeota archaeon]
MSPLKLNPVCRLEVVPTGLSLDQKGLRLACGTKEGQILLIEVMTGRIEEDVTGHEDVVSSLCFLGSDNSFLSTSWDATTRLWERRKATKCSASLSHHSEVKALAVSKTAGRGVSGSRDGELKVFSLSSLKCLRNISAHDLDVSAIGMDCEGARLVTASWDGQCKVWETSGYTLVRIAAETGERIRSMSLSPDTKTALLGLHGGTILKVFLESRERPAETMAHHDAVSSLAVDPTGKYLLSGGLDRAVKIWSLDGMVELTSARTTGAVSSVTWSPAGDSGYVADTSGSISRISFASSSLQEQQA